MKKYVGKSINAAIAIGEIVVFERDITEINYTETEDTKTEIERFEAAKTAVLAELDLAYAKALCDAGEAEAQIFEIHKMMVEDEDYNELIINMIEERKINAEYAVSLAGEEFGKLFSTMDDDYMQARESDIKDISGRLIACLGGKNTAQKIFPEGSIVCADDLAPSETILFDKDKVAGFVTAHGSANSHTAILARTMDVPAIIGVGEEFLENLEDGMTAIIDGYTGELILNPDEESVEKAQETLCHEKELKTLLNQLRGKEDITADGKRVNIFANIGSVEDLQDVIDGDAAGIGLFRSEFLYLQNSDYPSEEQQFLAYKEVLEKMNGKKVIIRTLDVGADKKVDYFDLNAEENPAMGLRAIRICLMRKDLFKVQLRALYRASVFGNLGIMFPMITSTEEVIEIMEICKEVRNQLSAENIAYSKDVEHGIMIETPAAALISDKLAPMVDFFSMGTNDLTQYTLACDRQNREIDRFFNPHHEAVLRLIKMSADNAHKHGKWIGICGELACDISLTKEFAKMGIDELSVPAPCVLPLRQKIRSINLSE